MRASSPRSNQSKHPRPMPHARVRSIDTSAALAMPGVKAIITADEHVFLGKDEITGAVEEKLGANARLKEEREVYVQADENVKYGAVLRVMAAARAAGVDKLGMITDPLVVK